MNTLHFYSRPQAHVRLGITNFLTALKYLLANFSLTEKFLQNFFLLQIWKLPVSFANYYYFGTFPKILLYSWAEAAFMCLLHLQQKKNGEESKHLLAD